MKPKKMTGRRAIYHALSCAMEEDSSVIILGEDIGLYGGAFQATAGLKKRFPDRVIETPISEGGFCGAAIGMALAGMKPVVEFMFMDFSVQALDQILNQATKFERMYNGQVKVPILFRTPAGGYKGYGATHSQSLENIFASIPNLNIVYPSYGQDYFSCLLYCIRELSGPTLFIENKTLYTKIDNIRTDIAYNPYPRVVHSVGMDVLVISYGHALHLVMEAMEKSGNENNWSVVDLVSLKPLHIGSLLEDIIERDYDRVIIVMESPLYASVSEHLAYELYKNVFGYIKNPIDIISSKDSFIPARKDLEAETLLSVDDIIAGIEGKSK